MESLNLNALAGSLPTSNLASAEKELLNNFRGKVLYVFPSLSHPRRLTHSVIQAAALSITTLYRSSRTTSKRAYNSGYAAACADLLQMIQQGVSDSETPPTIGRVMDWVEARLEAVRAREEEELEEDEENANKRDGQASKLKASSNLARANSAPATQQQSPREQAPLAPSKLSQSITPTVAPNVPPSTPPSPPATTARPLPPSAPPIRAPKPRSFASPIQAKENPIAATTIPSAIHPFPISPESPFTFTAFPPMPSSPAPTETLAIPLPLTVSAGAKRRHAMMVLADDPATAAGAATTGAGSSRRRTRSTRGAYQNQHLQDAMDIEEDGRERKRVARR
ncbi:hypothetical protein BJV78DRAFT_1285092 [Lactifluus subvellereus]|nr:hypothetical protein BJV78DRAFT_1285092 [Lactifluus subvellereus]